MALLFFDGFDHYGPTADPAALGKWGSVGSNALTSTVLARTGTQSFRFTLNTSELIGKALPASGGFAVGFAHYMTVALAANDLLQVREGTTVHVAIGITAGGLLTVKRGATVLATGTTVLALNTWHHIECQGTIDDATGTYEVKIGGVAEPGLTGTGADTRNGGATGQWDRIRLAPGAGSNPCYFDDVYVCDRSGAAPRNTLLGPVKVETLLPQTDAVSAGSNAGLTPSTGTDHGALVDDPAPNSTDYNSSPTVGLKDTYNYPSLTLTGAVLGVQTNLYLAKSDATARQVCAVVRMNGVDYDGANVSPLTTFAYVSEIRAQNPNTTAEWTPVDLTTIQAGMKVTA